MSQKARTPSGPIDTTLLWIISIILIIGIITFLSASLGVFAADKAKFLHVVLGHIGLGLVGGGIAAYILARTPIESFRRFAPWIFLGTFILTLLVFVPHIGFSHGGATRWIDLGFISFQPSEFLKIGVLFLAATWCAAFQPRLREIKYGLIPLVVLLGVVGGVLLLQPDTDTFLVIASGIVGIYFLAGGSWRDMLILALGGVLLGGALLLTRPYLVSRLKTFVDPTHDSLGSSYQVQQSMIAIGAGQTFGKGLGQGIQKFKYLPEPLGDSIFAVIGEEFGFVGTTVVILLFVGYSLRGFVVVRRVRPAFTALLAGGILIELLVQTFLNVASSVALFPLSGLPLPFISHGGTALFVSLVGVGIVLGASRLAEHRVS
jgi:cell division protein FtsW